MQQHLCFKLIICVLLLFFVFTSNGLAKDESTINKIESATATGVETVNQSNSTRLVDQSGGFLTGWLRLIDSTSEKAPGGGEPKTILAYASDFPADIVKALRASGGNKGLMGLWFLLMLSIVSICIGYFAVFALKKIFQNQIANLETIKNSSDNSSSTLTLALFKLISGSVELLIIVAVSSAFILLTSNWIGVENKMAFQLLLGAVLVIKLTGLITNALFAPEDPDKRLISLHESLVIPVARTVTSTISIVFISLFVVRYFRELGAQQQTVTWVFIVTGSFLIISICYQLVLMKNQIATAIKIGSEQDPASPQLADYWLFPTLFYLFVCWGAWIGQEFTGTARHNGALLGSILIIPIFLIVSWVGKGVISSILGSMNLFAVDKMDLATDDIHLISGHKEEQSPESKFADIAKKVHSFFKIFISIMLTAWLLNLWGYSVPFAQHAMKAIFQSMVVLILAVVCWQYASSYIEKKMVDAEPQNDENEESSDDEFGGAIPRGRSYTLLPMLRKVVAALLVVMVLLIVISSFGVNIGPLLAGAGVLGLAVGFGAQKLVSDVLSGFFFLFDDAFRVGEYIQAGSIKGTVETITLRNVLLRHHLGMLQVVPHSDLGAITNFMRGGVVIKFPLEFPYDTDIDKVRKIIKKVGQAMLDEPGLGEDFILPVKSQGVNEIANSVMVIKVKFTSKPGKQFVIKREAFRRITEALNAKNIYYAHRKVIVDFPEERQDETNRQKTLEAGAAAAMQVEQQ